MDIAVFVIATSLVITFIAATSLIINLFEKIKYLENRNAGLKAELNSTLTELISFKTLHSYKDKKWKSV